MRAPGAKTVLWAADIHVAQNVLPRGERPPVATYGHQTLLARP